MPLGDLDEEKICFSPNCFAQTCFIQINVGTPTLKKVNSGDLLG
ncbi:hypothetical protein LEP1GSC079_2388 [Leptospira interrogans str. FPW1039]|uniref:Uncharacterized protein n=2 Tax=Leptospira interrogans TaxID=173 RepID=A0A0F6IDJ0_LEPIR|nr:hypothetical protein LEP1GSC067_0353 [Leptospira interrogans serovar Lora str. TE 1992]EMJ36115.1 hypothetical protein LEP1GSC079_2388 [Leptospira interrogans str. FPW1039]EMN08731.1 hypothetical protein LEP1GSC053_2365 [Leptospira interrogans serovar Muenchen str. Brem 129]